MAMFNCYVSSPEGMLILSPILLILLLFVSRCGRLHHTNHGVSAVERWFLEPIHIYRGYFLEPIRIKSDYGTSP